MWKALGLTLVAVIALAFAVPAEARRAPRRVTKANTKVKNPFAYSGGFSRTRGRSWGHYRKSGSSRRYAKTRTYWRARNRHMPPQGRGRLHRSNFRRLSQPTNGRLRKPSYREDRSSRRGSRSYRDSRRRR